MPETVKLLQGLRKAGFKLRDDLYETERIIEELYSIFGKKEK